LRAARFEGVIATFEEVLFAGAAAIASERIEITSQDRK
jgi:hypothetical protein